jgi:hypothetical protein
MPTDGGRPHLSDADLSRLLTLLKGADSVELIRTRGPRPCVLGAIDSLIRGIWAESGRTAPSVIGITRSGDLKRINPSDGSPLGEFRRSFRRTLLEPRWGEITLAFVKVQIRSGLSVPLELGGGPIGTLDVYAVAPGGWDETEVSALQTYAGVVATMLGTAAKATVKGRLAEQLQVALNSRVLTEQARGALMERGCLGDQQAFIDLRRAARSSRRELPEVAGEVVAGLPLRRGPAKPAEAAEDRAPQLDMAALDAQVVAFLEQEPDADGGIGHRLSLLLLGFLGTEVVPLANRLAELGIDPSPLLAATSGILRLYADTLERPTLPGDAPGHA